MIFVIGMVRAPVQKADAGVRARRSPVHGRSGSAGRIPAPERPATPASCRSTSKLPSSAGVTTSNQSALHVEASPGLLAPSRHCRTAEAYGRKLHHRQARDTCLMIGRAAQWAADSGMGKRSAARRCLTCSTGRQEGSRLEPENTKSRCLSAAVAGVAAACAVAKTPA